MRYTIKYILIPFLLFHATILYLGLDNFKDILLTALMFAGMILKDLIND